MDANITSESVFRSSSIDAIIYNSVNTGTSENIFWSNISIQMCSKQGLRKTGYVIKPGPTEKFL